MARKRQKNPPIVEIGGGKVRTKDSCIKKLKALSKELNELTHDFLMGWMTPKKLTDTIQDRIDDIIYAEESKK